MPSTICTYLSLLLLGLALQQAPVSAHLRRTKGIRAVTGSVKDLERALKGGDKKGKKEDVQEELDALDREETTYFVGEDGAPLYIPVEEENNDGQEGENFNFEDLEVWDRIDTEAPGTVIDVSGSDEPEGIPVEQEEDASESSDEDPGEEDDSSDEDPGEEEEFIFDEEDDILGTEYNETFANATGYNETLPTKYNETMPTEYKETIPTEYNETMSTEYNETMPTDREDSNYSDMDELTIVTDGYTGIPDSGFTDTDSQLEERVLRLEIQVDTLLTLNDTVAELELKLGESMEIIARHEQLIGNLSSVVRILREAAAPPAHISLLSSSSEP